MDSTTPDPQPQSQLLTQQQQQQQQQSQQMQPTHQQPKPQQPPPQQSHQIRPPAPIPHQQDQPHPQHPIHHQTSYWGQSPYPPSYTYRNSHPGYYATGYYQQPYQPAPWTPTPASYPQATAQQVTNIITPQSQSNVPQHNKPSSQAMNPDRPPNQTMRPVNTASTGSNMVAPGRREKRVATLKDPKTQEVIDLDNLEPSTTKSSSSIPKPPTNASPATTVAQSVHVHELLQKVSEDNNSESTVNNVTKQQQQAKKQPELVRPTVVEEEGDKEEKAKKQEANVESEPSDKATKNATTNGQTQLPVKPQQQPQESSPKSDEAIPKTNSSSPATNTIDTTITPSATTTTTATNEDDKDDSSPPKVEASIPEDKSDAKVDNKEGDSNREEDKDDNSKDQEESKPEISLEYEPGQYNPATKIGKKKYSKQFMLDVCEKLCKIDIFKENNDDKIDLGGSQLPGAFSDGFDPFKPNFSTNRYGSNNRPMDTARPSQHNYGGRNSAGQERQRKIIPPSISLSQDVELKTCSNPWKPTKEVKDEEAPGDVVETESLKKKFRSILNKLTPNNFENLAKAVTDLNIDTESKLGEVIDIVFAKALAEPGYCVLYGQMCSHLKKITAGQANFGNTLLKRCQSQFQADIYSGLNLEERKEKIEAEESADVKKQLNEELYEDMYRCRMRSLGLIKFIGELYKIEMLNDAIMLDCVVRLLTDTSEESLECLCDLLATIGEKLDRSSKENIEKDKKAPKSASKNAAYQNGQKTAAAVVASGSTSSQQRQQKAAELPTTLDPIFEQLHKIRKNKDLPLSVRIRFKLLDICELREKEVWQSKKTKDNNPKKIDEIREAHKEKLEQERRQQNAMGPRRSQEGRRLGGSGGSSNQISSLANESSGRGGSNMHTSSSSHLIRDHSQGEMKSNHYEIESQKDHQRKLEGLKVLGLFKEKKDSGSKLSNEPSKLSLRPHTTNFRPMSSSMMSKSIQQQKVSVNSTESAAAPGTATPPAVRGPSPDQK